MKVKRTDKEIVIKQDAHKFTFKWDGVFWVAAVKVKPVMLSCPNALRLWTSYLNALSHIVRVFGVTWINKGINSKYHYRAELNLTNERMEEIIKMIGNGTI